MVRVNDRPALEGAERAHDLDTAAGPLDGDLCAGGDETAFFGPGGDADAAIGPALAPPAERSGGSLDDCPEPLVAQVFQSELERVETKCMGQLVHVRLAGEVVCRGGERAVRALAQG